MGLFDFLKPAQSGSAGFAGIQDPQWARSPKGGSFNFMRLEPEKYDLAKASGVFVIWHGGVKPEWLYVGKSNNLENALYDMGDNGEVTSYQNRGGVFVTWAFVKSEFQDGVVTYLTDVLKPLIENSGYKKTKPIPVQTP